MNLPPVSKLKQGNGSRSRYLGQLCAIRDFERHGKQVEIELDEPQQMIDEITNGGFRSLILLKDLVKFSDFEIVEGNERIDDTEVYQWYKRQWAQMEGMQLIAETVDRFGGKQEFVRVSGLRKNLVNNLYSFRSLADPMTLHAFKACRGITDPLEYGDAFRAVLKASK